MACLQTMCTLVLGVLKALGNAIWPDESMAASDAADGDTATSSAPPNLLPWWMLLGRCCIIASQNLPPQSPGSSAATKPYASATGRSTPPRATACQCAAVQEAPVMSVTHEERYWHAAACHQHTVSAHEVFLLVDPLVQQLQSTSSAMQAALRAGAESSDLALAAVHLHDLGLQLNTLAFSSVCNNPYCSNLAGLSELDLVKGSGRVCSGCRMARYCSQGCHVEHWRHHRPFCKAMAAAREAAALAHAARAEGSLATSEAAETAAATGAAGSCKAAAAEASCTQPAQETSAATEPNSNTAVAKPAAEIIAQPAAESGSLCVTQPARSPQVSAAGLPVLAAAPAGV